MQKENRIPFVYFIQSKTTGLKYIGVRYAKKCHPKELWVSYFTSSTSVHKLINLYGKEDFKTKILHVFDKEEDAILREWNYTKLAVKRKDYLNFCSFPASPSIDQSKKGILGGNIQKRLRLGIHKQTKEERLAIGRLGLERKRELGLVPFNDISSEAQALRGKIGGPKNKGYVWITDGTKQIKFTVKMQNFQTLDEFLLENKNFKKGRAPGYMEYLKNYNTGRKRKTKNENKENNKNSA